MSGGPRMSWKGACDVYPGPMMSAREPRVSEIQPKMSGMSEMGLRMSAKELIMSRRERSAGCRWASSFRPTTGLRGG